MTIKFPAPAPAADKAAGPGFPVYAPDPDRNEAPPDISSAQNRMAASTQAPPDKWVKHPEGNADYSPPNPLGDYHMVAQTEPGNERELMFTIGGVPLYAPREEDISPQIGLRMIRDLRKYGPALAVATAMGDLLGDEALDLLADAKGISREEWLQIMDVLQDKVFSKFQENMPGTAGKG